MLTLKIDSRRGGVRKHQAASQSGASDGLIAASIHFAGVADENIKAFLRA